MALASSSGRPHAPYSSGVNTVVGTYMYSVCKEQETEVSTVTAFEFINAPPPPHTHTIYSDTTPTYIELALCKKSPCQKFPCLDGQWRQLVLPLQHITDGIDVWHAGLLIHCWDITIAGFMRVGKR